MKREELANLDPSKVRKDKSLFALFKKYATEDAAEVFPDGKLPSGCFGCSFSRHFATWRRHYITTKTEFKMSQSTGKTYELASPNFRVYFKGKVLNSQSTDGEWIDWINHPEEDEKRKKRTSQFSKLPEEVKPETKKTRAKKAVEETKDPEEVKPETNE